MRRAPTPNRLRLDPAPAPAIGRAELGRAGWRIAPADPPAGARLAAGPDLRAVAAVPIPAHEVAIVANGELVLAAVPGVAHSLRAPQMTPIHDRRPPGLARIAGAPRANAGLLRSDGGWRAVVLPSLGDVAADLGEGPLALRADARRLAAAAGAGIVEVDLPGGAEAASHPGPAGPLAYDGDGRLVVGAGGIVTAVGMAAGPGSAIVALAGAAGAPRVLARHADGVLSLWDTRAAEPAEVGRWEGPPEPEVAIGLSADGTLATCATPFAEAPLALVAGAADGALVRHIAGARALALSPDAGSLVVAGEWGMVWLSPIEES